jgi:hypothetical protein
LDASKLEGIYRGLINSSNRGPGGADLAGGLDTLVGQGTVFNNIDYVITELNKTNGNFSPGAAYVLRAVSENPAVLGGKTLDFEYTVRAGE